MRLLKSQTTNLRSVKGKGVKYNLDNEAIIDTNKVLLLAKGTTAERPTFAKNGHMRYNVDIDEFEFYVNGTWKVVRFEEPPRDGIIQQNLGNGDGAEIFFGPLDPIPEAAPNILVFIENVFQISGINYFLTQNPPGKSEGWYLEFTSPPDIAKPITVLHNFDK